ncbi:kinetochore Sim4 complex subunit FTA2-domain-containing protein [Chaetomium sp. MPI-CAGE-AT-0009]|nr:kinetochore Sim4 complex subunit FTA2-domain-containing protein [Chaetomium sp. MPI-CAGE-AT-0009]
MSLPKLSPSLPKPLPQVPGPKLAPFTRTGHAVIQFVKELGSPGADGRVWEVKIKGKAYALKMFKFNPPDYLRHAQAAHLFRELSSPSFYTDYFDPFSCECRAYGGLKEENREHLAVRSHGYLFLTPAQELEITRLIVESEPSGDNIRNRSEEDSDRDNIRDRSEEDRDNIWDRSEEDRDLPLRAIVKDVAESQDFFTVEQVPGMWEDPKGLHELGIMVRDIRVNNYLGGKLIDFSRSWSTPHPGWAALDRYDIKQERKADPHGLNKAAIELGIGKRWDWDKVVIPDELVKCSFGEGPNQYGVDPRLYDWLKWERDPIEASAFLEKHVFARPVGDDKH